MKLITFTNKIEYLAWRQQWKAEYKDLSKRIRLLKLSINEGQRNRQYVGGLQNELRDLRAEATQMIELRKQSKVEAQKQYLASLQAK
jgi:hypothetical protein